MKAFNIGEKFFAFLFLLTCASFSTNAIAGQFRKGEIRFATPPWPGVLVKTNIVTHILQRLGYKTSQSQLGTSLAFQSLADKDIDVFLGYWSPNMDNRAHKYIQKGAIQVLTNNVNNAAWGIGVPGYVWKSGVHSIADLVRNRKKFGGKIYGIEIGSVMNAKIQKAIDMNAGGLGDWTLVPSSTAIMLAQVKRRTDKHQWVAWGAWSPHWMMSAFNTHFLKNATKASLGNKVVIKTVVPKGFKKQHPNVARFLMQFHVSSSTQSQWIYKYKFANIPMDGLVSNWIKSHRKEVSKWLAGVRTRDGQQAVKVIRQP